jgi:hypothetical protein
MGPLQVDDRQHGDGTRREDEKGRAEEPPARFFP